MKTCIVFVKCALGVVLAFAAGCASAESGAPRVAEPEVAEARSGYADPVAGQTVFDTHCAACHRAGRHDPDGDAPDLARRKISRRLLARHHGEALSEVDAANLRTFLAGQ